MTTWIQVYAKEANINLEDNSVVLQGFDLSQLLAEFPLQEVFEAIKDSDQFSTLVDLVNEELNKDDE